MFFQADFGWANQLAITLVTLVIYAVVFAVAVYIVFRKTRYASQLAMLSSAAGMMFWFYQIFYLK